MQGTSRSELAAELEGCARLSEDTAELYVARYGDRAGAGLVSALLLAAAALETAGRVVEERGPARETALMIARTLVTDAIEAAERRGLDEMLLHCVARLRRVAALCDRELGS
jgi:hypothetical protein